MVTETLSNVRT